MVYVCSFLSTSTLSSDKAIYRLIWLLRLFWQGPQLETGSHKSSFDLVSLDNLLNST